MRDPAFNGPRQRAEAVGGAGFLLAITGYDDLLQPESDGVEHSELRYSVDGATCAAATSQSTTPDGGPARRPHSPAPSLPRWSLM